MTEHKHGEEMTEEDRKDLARADEAEAWLLAHGSISMTDLGDIGIVGGVAAHQDKPLNPDDPNFVELRLERLRELGGRLGTDLSGIGILGGTPPQREEGE